MSQVKIVLVLSVLLQTCIAYDLPPFTWKALEEAEKHASTAAVSLYAESIKLQQAVKECVFAPEVDEVTPVESCKPVWEPCRPQHQALSHNVICLLLTLLAIPAAFLLGWLGGVRQAESSQALQQARAADQAEADATEHEEAARLAANAIQIPAVNDTDSACDRQPNQPLHQQPQLHTELQASTDCAAANHWSSPDDSEDGIDTQVNQHQQVSHESHLLVPNQLLQQKATLPESCSNGYMSFHMAYCTNAETSNPVARKCGCNAMQDDNSSQGSVAQPGDVLEHQSRPVDGHTQEESAAAMSSLSHQHQQRADDDHDSNQPSSSRLHVQPAQQALPSASQQASAPLFPQMSASHQQSALTHASAANRQLPNGGLQPMSAPSEEAAALNTAFTILEVVIQRLGIRPHELDQQQRVSLVSPVVQAIGVYLDLLNHRETHR